jgi:hypothetical protein
MDNIIVCSPKRLPRTKWVAAAKKAVEVNPLNHVPRVVDKICGIHERREVLGDQHGI